MPEQILDQILRVKHSADLAERLDAVKRISNMSTREFASLIRELLEALCDDVERVGEMREPLIVMSMQEVQDLRKAVVALRQENDTLKDVVRIFTDSRKVITDHNGAVVSTPSGDSTQQLKPTRYGRL